MNPCSEGPWSTLISLLCWAVRMREHASPQGESNLFVFILTESHFPTFLLPNTFEKGVVVPQIISWFTTAAVIHRLLPPRDDSALLGGPAAPRSLAGAAGSWMFAQPGRQDRSRSPTPPGDGSRGCGLAPAHVVSRVTWASHVTAEQSRGCSKSVRAEAVEPLSRGRGRD